MFPANDGLFLSEDEKSLLNASLRGNAICPQLREDLNLIHFSEEKRLIPQSHFQKMLIAVTYVLCGLWQVCLVEAT